MRFRRRQRYTTAELALSFILGGVFAKMVTDPGASEAMGRFLAGFFNGLKASPPPRGEESTTVPRRGT